VVDAIESQLSLTQSLVEPSRAGLYRFGNISSSSIWYVLAYIESYKGLNRGERVWQMGFGSGFKCNSAVWRVNRCGWLGGWLAIALFWLVERLGLQAREAAGPCGVPLENREQPHHMHRGTLTPSHETKPTRN